MANTIGEKELKTEWPLEDGLDAGTTRKRQDYYLIPEEKSLIPERTTKGIR